MFYLAALCCVSLALLSLLAYNQRNLATLMFAFAVFFVAKGCGRPHHPEEPDLPILAYRASRRMDKCTSTTGSHCPICLETTNVDWISTPCKHTFHYTCLFTWMTRHDTCPVCRSTL